MHFGINTYLFSAPFTNDAVKYFPQYKKWGFDSVEIALENSSHIDPLFVRDELDKHGLRCTTVCAAMSPAYDFRGTDKQQEDAEKYLRSLIDVMPLLGAQTLAGPMYSATGRADAVSQEEHAVQWKLVVQNLQRVANYAGEKNMVLALEPLNRFETDFLNTIQQTLDLIGDINTGNVYIHYDTFHMNIEEKDQGEAIKKAGKYLGHFHACGCDRGTPGKDHINWKGISEALTMIRYNGEVAIESFTQDVKVIAKAAAIWRKIEASQEEIAVEGVRFLRQTLG